MKEHFFYTVNLFFSTSKKKKKKIGILFCESIVDSFVYMYLHIAKLYTRRECSVKVYKEKKC